jgi:3-deoxy-D-manno-oct-2-ulosonic acid (Kdo) hydroxylase
VIEGTVKLLTLVEGDFLRPGIAGEALEAVESGGLVFLADVGFELKPSEAEILSDVGNVLERAPASENGRPTLIFDPRIGHMRRLQFARAGGRLARARVKKSARRDLESMLMRYAGWTEEIVTRLFPRYTGLLEADRVTYRPNPRSVPQPLHVDSAYGDPTGGRGMLRLFTNVDPLGRPRTWQVGEPFESFARRFVPSLDAPAADWTSALLAWLGIVGRPRSPYDRMIAQLRRLGKRDEAYQRTAPRRIVEFPSGSSWLAITDLVLHGAVSGQHSLDRTFYLPATAMRDPSRSSLSILERATGRKLS